MTSLCAYDGVQVVAVISRILPPTFKKHLNYKTRGAILMMSLVCRFS